MTNPLPELLKLKALKPGDMLAVISTSYPAGYPEAEQGERIACFEQALAWIERQGYRVKLMPNAHKRQHYLAGSDQERLDDLMAAFADPEVNGILCSRGGYGTMRIVEQIDFALIRNHPKVFIGFSDLTTLHIAFYQQCGLVGFYGPMLTTSLMEDTEPYSSASLLALVSNQIELPYEFPNQAESYHCIQAGITEAPLTGGNLTLLASLCGTPYQPQTDGHILFLEDWHEKHYSLDRKYQQLKLAGLFEHIQGLVFCDFSHIDPEPGQSLPEFFSEITRDLQAKNIPIGYGFSVGHGEQTGTLSYGLRCRFDSVKGSLTLLESPFI